MRSIVQKAPSQHQPEISLPHNSSSENGEGLKSEVKKLGLEELTDCDTELIPRMCPLCLGFNQFSSAFNLKCHITRVHSGEEIENQNEEKSVLVNPGQLKEISKKSQVVMERLLYTCRLCERSFKKRFSLNANTKVTHRMIRKSVFWLEILKGTDSSKTE